jgi:hypothetical protein
VRLRPPLVVPLALLVSALIPACDRGTPSVRAERPGRLAGSANPRGKLLHGIELGPASAPLLDDRAIDWEQNPVMRRLGRVAETLTESEYTYGLAVNEKSGVYRFDCSGMAQWVLRRSAPIAAITMAHGLPQRPLARDFQRRVARAPTDRDRGGWRRIERVADLVPGDVVAWVRPPEIQSPNTGHVAFVLLPPVLAPGYDNAYLVRIADSSRLLHDDDTRVGRSGFGFGTILLVADPETGAPTAYGWVALKWRAFETQIALGRPMR